MVRRGERAGPAVPGGFLRRRPVDLRCELTRAAAPEDYSPSPPGPRTGCWAASPRPSPGTSTTQGQSQPVFALAHLLGFDLMPTIRNWKGLAFYGPSKQTEYVHTTRRSARWGRTSSTGT
ncbi:Tn3 family transposase [Streptomyces sp. NPDC007020]|uniref:Tn3 family transposase n=1 Tax=Streptomyces sp. NPDC007020 TaxID=3154585 RepID=UPI0034029B9E